MPRRPLFERLPEAWRRLDQAGVLEAYLGVWDDEFDSIHDKVQGLLDLRSVDRIPNRYLQLLSDIVGHEWDDTKSYDWNRERIRHAIHRWSYKGTIAALEDIVKEHGGGPWSVTDMASTLWVWSRQGCWSRGDQHYVAEDYFHPGAFELSVGEDVDIAALQEDLQKLMPAGEVWYIALDLRNLTVMEIIFTTEILPHTFGFTYPSTLWNETHWYNYERQLGCEITIHDMVIESSSIAVSGGRLGVRGMATMDNQQFTMDASDTDYLTESLAAIQLPIDRIEEIIP